MLQYKGLQESRIIEQQISNYSTSWAILLFLQGKTIAHKKAIGSDNTHGHAQGCEH